MKKILFTIILIFLILCFVELIARVAFDKVFPYGEKTIALLTGEERTNFQRVIGQSYLNYVPAPNYTNEAGIQHNAHGYRGSLVEVAKSESVLRILCLGGSTTYGWCVEKADQTYPAQLEQILNQSPSKGYKRVEVLNAGIPWGTSAELVTHYHFKYHYYQPDWVIIHTGLNDAQIFHKDYYQPDYSHWRKQMPPPPVLPKNLHWLTRSKLVDLLLIPLFMGMCPEEPTFNIWDEPPIIPWFEKEIQNQENPLNIPTSKIAFVHNVESLVGEIQRAGARVALMPIALQPSLLQDPAAGKKFEEEYWQNIEHTRFFESLLKSIAKERNVSFISFPTNYLYETNWVDGIHLDEVGSRIKAKHVANFIQRNNKGKDHATD